MATETTSRQAWIKAQVEALIDLGDDPREAEGFVRGAMALLPPWADPATDLPNPTAAARAAALDAPALFDARVEWYASDAIPARFRRLLDARLRVEEVDDAKGT